MNSLISKKIRALLVEDSEEDAILIIRELKSSGLDVSFLQVDNEQAMQDALEDDWDVILSDCSMPKFSALAALDTLEKSGKDLPFIVVSGAIGEDIAVKLMQTGAHDYVMKGNLTRLASAIDREIGEAKVRIQKKEGIIALEHAVEEWDVTFNAMSDAVFILSAQYGIVKCNRAAESLIGKKREDIVGKCCYSIMHETLSPIGECPYQKMFKSKHRETSTFNYNNRILEVNVDPIFDENQQLIGSVHTISDITERIHNEKKLKVALAAAESANVAKSEFLATMSHEIRTPLNGILGFADILSDSLPLDELDNGSKYKEQFQIIQQCGATLLAIINDILEVSQIECGKFKENLEEFSPKELFEESINAFKFKVDQKNIEINLKSEKLPALVIADPRRLRQINFNLLGNAIKFTDSGSIDIYVNYLDGKLNIIFKDTGIGIPPDELEKINTPFYQVDQSKSRSVGGNGLGLAIVQKTLDKLGGSLELKSKEGEGTEVNVLFPVSIADPNK
jgi:PAS domain S-box-containing protein